MSLTRDLAVGLFGCVVSGTVLGAFAPGIESGPGFTTIDVPIGSIGDNATYAMFERDPDLGTWSASGGRAFHVVGTGASVQRDLRPRDVLKVDLGANDGADWIIPRRLEVDLGTRDVVRYGYELRESTVKRSWATSRFGPAGDGAWLGTHELSYLNYQGKRYTFGDDLTARAKDLFLNQWGLRYPGIELLAFENRVAERGRIDGQDVLGIRFAGAARLDVAAKSVYELSPGRDSVTWRLLNETTGATPFLSTWVPRQSDVVFTRTVWVASDVPYPLVIDDEVVVNGSRVLRVQGLLDSWTTGKVPIPWNADDAPAPGAFVVERGGPSGRFPADGAATALDFRLSQAVAAAESSTLVGFAAWRQRFPEHYLVGASLNDCTLDQCRQGQDSWQLVYATPTPDPMGAYYVQVVQAKGAGLPVVTRHHPFQLITNVRTGETTFSGADLPRDAVTLSEAERAWSKVATPAMLNLRHVAWGFPFARASGLPEGALVAAFLDRESLQRVVFGYDAEIRGANVRSLLALNVTSGRIVSLTETAFYQAEGPLPSLSNMPVMRPDALSASPAAAAPLDVERAGWFSGSLLALFLFAYFFPLVKFAVSTFLQVVPGYAKLSRGEIEGNRFREQLVDLIRAEPGITPPELHRRVGGGWSTIVYHLGRLEQAKLVSSLIDGRHKRFFPVETIDYSKRGQLAVLKNERSRLLHELVLAEPGLIQRVLSRRLGISVPSTIWHIRRLEKAGLLAHDRQGRTVAYYGRPPDAAGPVAGTQGIEVV